MGVERGNPWAKLGGGPLIAPSLLACDFARMGEQITTVTEAGARLLHVDVMDGHFVPNLSMGPPIVASVRTFTPLPLDVHLMVTDPAYYAERFAEAGADSITFHVEACDEPLKLIERLRELGLGAGLTLRPGTEADSLKAFIAAVDLVMVMTVEPGYGGQAFLDAMLDKIAAVREMLRDDQRLEVDGGIGPETARRCAEAGADLFVVGTGVFRAPDIPKALGALQTAVQPAASGA